MFARIAGRTGRRTRASRLIELLLSSSSSEFWRPSPSRSPEPARGREAPSSALTSDLRNGGREIETYFTANPRPIPRTRPSSTRRPCTKSTGVGLLHENNWFFTAAPRRTKQSFTYCVAADDGAVVMGHTTTRRNRHKDPIQTAG